jgi:hypothetical protein
MKKFYYRTNCLNFYLIIVAPNQVNYSKETPTAGVMLKFGIINLTLSDFSRLHLSAGNSQCCIPRWGGRN